VNWQLARLISNASPQRRKTYLQAGLVLNIGYLCTFKYLNFFIGSIPYFAHHHILAPELAFPLGISFFTLAQIMYLIDCYEQLMPPSSLFDHATFVSFFPYVISGPISRPKRIVHQFPALNGFAGPDADTVARAMYLFSMGLVKKVVLADAFSKAADYGFANISSLSTVEAWCFAISYVFQIYFDFSGYSDMAIASALFFGIDVQHNFDAPLRTKSIIEFWQRWHISLTSFITTYIYTPILKSFSRVTLARSAFATLLAMTIAGLWHGPNWTFVIFGAIHGLGLATNQYWRKKKMPKIPILASWLITFLVYLFSFVFFRAPDIHASLFYFSRMFSWHLSLSGGNLAATYKLLNGEGPMAAILLIAQIAGIVAALAGKSTDQLGRDFKPTMLNYLTVSACALFALFYLNSSVAKPFVYFRF